MDRECSNYTALNHLLLKSCFLASISMLLVGSEPMDKKQTMGTRGVDSFHISSRLRMTPSAYFTPIDSAMYLRACGSTRSGHQDLQVRSNRMKGRQQTPLSLGYCQAVDTL